MYGIDGFAAHADAVAVLGIVLAEAVLLYVGYGILGSVVDPLVARVVARA